MSDAELLQAYLVEARENLQAMEEGFLALEQNPADSELINDVFRAMHSIKGGAGMVGLTQVNLLAHRLENILDRVRKTGGAIPDHLLNLLFSGMDLLRQMLGGDAADSPAFSAQLDELLQLANSYEDTDTPEADDDRVELGGFIQNFETKMLEEMIIKGKPVYQLEVTLDPACILKAVRSYMVLQTAAANSEIIKVTPPVEELETENFADTILLLLATEADMDELCNDLAGVSEVISTNISRLSVEKALQLINAAEPPDPVPHDTPAPAQLRGPHYYRLTLSFDPGTVQAGLDPIIFLFELQEQGRILERYLNISRLPELDAMDPCSLYLSWTIFMETKLSAANLQEIFSMLPDDSSINIEEITSELDQWFQGDKKTGELLVERGLVSPDEIEAVLQKQKRIGELLVEEGKLTGKQMEQVIQSQQRLREQEQSDTIRVETGKLEEILNSVAELLIAQSRAKEMTFVTTSQTVTTDLFNAFQDVDKIIRRLQEEVMNVSMIPIGGTFTRFQRMVRDLAKELDKEVDLRISGRETELDKKIIEQIADPLKHLIRNCMDHGLETPAERKAAGKPAKGTIRLNAFHQEGSIVIEIADDGRGINEEAVLAKARAQGLVDEGSKLSKEEIQRLIFMPGFSTAKEVSDVSGRGVGLDVVISNIRKLRGSVELSSTPGEGTTLYIKLPLTLAIIDGMMVRVGKERYIIPLTSIMEFIKAAPGDIRQAEGKGIILHLRREYIPCAGLYQLIDIQPDYTRPADGIITILKDGRKKLALLVDEIIGQEQVVIKSIKENMEQVRGIAGATIMGDGQVAVILDVASLFSLAREKVQVEISV